MIIDVDAVNYLNETVTTEVIPGDVSIGLGIIFILIGLYILYSIVSSEMNERQKLKRFGS
jgi:hypothetical protein